MTANLKMAIFIVALFHSLLAPGSVAADEGETKISGLRVKACQTALAEFSKTGYSLEKYTVFISDHDAKYDVAFVPQQAPDKPTVRGGATEYGREIHYLISKVNFRLVRVEYAR